MSEKSKTEEQMHYESLIQLHSTTVKFVGGALAIIISAGLYFNYKDAAEMRQDVRTELTETRQEMKDLEILGKQSIEQTKQLSENTITNIRDDARNATDTVIRNEVELAFRKNNIQSLINQAAQQELDKKMNAMVTEKVDKSNQDLNNYVSSMPDFMFALDRLRWGQRPGLDSLINIRDNSKDSRKREMAKRIITEKSVDYTRTYQGFRAQLINNVLSFYNGPYDSTNVELVKALKARILNEQDLNNMAAETFALSKVLGKELVIFDLESVKKLNF